MKKIELTQELITAIDKLSKQLYKENEKTFKELDNMILKWNPYKNYDAKL